MSIGARIRQVRKSAGLTQQEFGNLIGITAAGVSSLEIGKTSASPQTIRSISREFGVSEAWLRDGVGEMRPPPDRDAELGRMVASLFRARPEGFRRRLLTLLLSWAPDGPEWALLEKIVRDLQAETTAQATPEASPAASAATADHANQAALEPPAAPASQPTPEAPLPSFPPPVGEGAADRRQERSTAPVEGPAPPRANPQQPDT